MAWRSIPHRISVDDVIPAEGVADVVDGYNDARDAFYQQHDRYDARHTDYGPFVVARVMIEFLSNGKLRTVQSAGVAGVALKPKGAFVYTTIGITVNSDLTLIGGSTCVRYTNNVANSITKIAPVVVLSDDKAHEAWVSFGTIIASTDLSHLHVLLRGYFGR